MSATHHLRGRTMIISNRAQAPDWRSLMPPDPRKEVIDFATMMQEAAKSPQRKEYRLDGGTMSAPGSLVAAYTMSDAEVQELETRAAEERRNEEINFKYAYEHQYQNAGQEQGGWSGPAAPRSMLPAFTARNLSEIMQELLNSGALPRHNP
jgi:hypothetical protein